MSGDEDQKQREKAGRPAPKVERVLGEGREPTDHDIRIGWIGCGVILAIMLGAVMVMLALAMALFSAAASGLIKAVAMLVGL